MKAVIRLALLPLRMAPWAGLAIGVLIGFGGLLQFFLPAGKAAVTLILLGVGLWFLWMLAGFALKSIAQPETLLLPNFHRALFTAAALWGLTFWLLPAAAIVLLFSWQAGWWALSGGALAIAWALLSSIGVRGAMYFWVLFIAANLLPKWILQMLVGVLDNPLLPAAALLLSVLLLGIVWRRLFPHDDPTLPETPFLPPSPGRRSGSRSPLPASKFRRRFNEWVEVGNDRRLQRCAARYQAQPGPVLERTLLRILLFPHEQIRGWLGRWVVYGGILSIYLLTIGKGFSADWVAGYTVFLAMTGLNTVGLGMPRLRPSLLDLYFDLAPTTHATFKTRLVDSFLGLLPGAILSAYVYTGLVSLWLAPHALIQILATTTVLVPPLALATLALYINLPEGKLARILINFITVAGQVIAYWMTYLLLSHLGILAGGGLALIVAWAFALGTWQAARQHFIKSPLHFDPPVTQPG